MTRGKIIIRSTGFIIQITSFENNKKISRGGGGGSRIFSSSKKKSKYAFLYSKCGYYAFL